MNVLVTGAETPIGQYLAGELASRGERVVGGQENAPGSLDELIAENGVDGIVHARGATEDPTAGASLGSSVLTPAQGIIGLLEAARRAAFDGRLVIFSSYQVYGDNDATIDESAPIRPRSLSAVGSITVEHLAQVYTDVHGLDVISLRLAEAYGPGLGMPSLLGRLMSAAIGGSPFRAPAGAEQGLHLIHGQDVARAVLAALEAPAPRQRVYNISGGERHSLASVVALVRARFPHSRIDLGPGAIPGLERQGPLDIRAADRDLDYRPRWGLARGIDDTLDWLLSIPRPLTA
jgi:UDP-glucose 4-epimerase